MVALQFGYWNIRGLMQPIRLLCEHLGIEWQESQYDLKLLPDGTRDPSEWTNEKNKLGLDFPNLPWMIDTETNVKLTQSNAILRYVCHKFRPELLGTSLQEQALVDMIIGVLADLKQNMTRVAYGPADEYDKELEAFSKTAQTHLTTLEKYLGEKPYLVGSNITYADFVCYELLDVLHIMVPNLFADPTAFRGLNAYLNRVRALPKIAEYIASDRCIKRPINNKSAAFK